MNDMTIIQIDQSGGEPRVSSLQIAELIDKRHDNVKRTVERLVKEGVIQCPPTEDIKNHQNRTMTVYMLNEREAMIVVAQMDAAYTGRLVDAFRDLRDKAMNQPAVPATYVAALQAHIDAVRDLEQANTRIEDLEPRDLGMDLLEVAVPHFVS